MLPHGMMKVLAGRSKSTRSNACREGAASKQVVVFVTLAMNQTRFFDRVASRLEEKGYSVALICFHEGSYHYLRKRSRTAFNGFSYVNKTGNRQPQNYDGDQTVLSNINFVMSHEKAAFGINDSKALENKYLGFVLSSEKAFNELERDSSRITLVQELGGFLSNVAAFRIARSRGIDNLFLEPSFFRRRVFIVRNSFSAPKIRATNGQKASQEVCSYLSHFIARQQPVIPSKDRKHFRNVLSKLTDPYNWKRLCQKLWDKYGRRQREEFEYIGIHVRRHLRMGVTELLLRRHYKDLNSVKQFIYYPLHVPADVALTLRSPEFYDQYALLDYVARVLPGGIQLVTKEHPALIGAVDYARIRELLRRHDNMTLVDPATNNFELLKRATVVLTVNSKSGAEALLLGKPVLVLGDAFYGESDLVIRVQTLGDLKDLLKEVINAGRRMPSEKIEQFFQAVWDSSHPGELYDLDEENIQEFTRSLEENLTVRFTN